MKVLLSIKPEFVEKIISGEKKFEFRKSLPKREGINSVVVYATMPVGKVVGEFRIKQTLSLEPESLWDKTKELSGISKCFFDQYFSNKVLAHAFEIDFFEPYLEPKHISEVLKSGVAPQSYCYI
ncbi:50S ribosomal protein L22/uncharacterised domain fusion protein [Phocoenobacter uteri]|uniref:50S ribosomal protein L22/uncharacterized domain fusion protein n=1 Tax=Phocoenobacter uteri TaxID=146806 RepID=A0A379CA32_9PAST|nr:ASCH domain-containing protein [Phocoenobacter uteri]MDG6880971.1 hypothetical protein [Phocoenobacter uteri]SUB58988.1 50S ribosomal protein L22/uncharacterised domain fusion protein [Phocoenobacter uteri]